MKKQLLTFATLAIGALVGASALSAFATGTFTPPTATPPGANVDAPINVGLGDPINHLQEKLGSLWLHGGLAVDGNLVVATGSPMAGQVLTAQDSTGTATWSTPVTDTNPVPLQIETGVSTIPCATNNVWRTEDVTFETPFDPAGPAPIINLTSQWGVGSGWPLLIATGITNTGFTLQAKTDTGTCNNPDNGGIMWTAIEKTSTGAFYTDYLGSDATALPDGKVRATSITVLNGESGPNLGKPISSITNFVLPSGTNFFNSATTRNAICASINPTTPYMKYFKATSFDSPSNNYVVERTTVGSAWIRVPAWWSGVNHIIDKNSPITCTTPPPAQ